MSAPLRKSGEATALLGSVGPSPPRLIGYPIAMVP